MTTSATSAAVDGFRLTYDRVGRGDRPVVLLHGWPGDRHDYDAVVPLLSDDFDVVVPDLRGFGDSDKHRADPADGHSTSSSYGTYSAAAQAASVAGLLHELGLAHPVIAGYDVGSWVAQTLARERPELVGALALSPPLPGAGDRVLSPASVPEFWYQSFHQLDLAEQLIDGDTTAVRHYLTHFWTHWSGPDFTLPPEHLDRLVASYSAPGAYVASISWYRAGAGTVARAATEQAPRPEQRIATPTQVLWPAYDPLFPRGWSDRIEEFFADATLHYADGVGHFTPLECPAEFAELVRRAARTAPA